MTVNIVEGKVGLKFIAVVEFSFGGWELTGRCFSIERLWI